MDSSTQLSEIVEQLRSISERLGHIEDKLMLVTDIDRYGKLQEFLKAGKLEEADTETSEIILTVANKDRETFTPNDILSFPCDVLLVIDRLWKTYSKDRFGFSIQMSIYLDIGGNTESLLAQDVELLRQFGERVGWRTDEGWITEETYSQSDFSLNAPVGFFPAVWWKSPYGAKMVYFCFTRLLSCNLYEDS
jgi:GUN4-like